MLLNNEEILYRESRTAISLPKIDRRSLQSSVQSEKSPEIYENCDKSQNKFTKISRPKIKKINLKNNKNLLSLVLSICIIILLTRLSEAKPTHHHHHNHHHHHHHHHNHHKQRSSDTMSDVFDFKCRFEMPEDPKMDNQKPENVLSDRLRAILLGCQDTLAQTKDLIDEYIKTMWTQNVEELHKTWKHEDLLWLHPNNTPLQKEFNKSINAEHLAELKKVNWKDQNKVFEYLGRIYQRLERVYVGIQIVNKWIELAQMDQNKNIMNNTELDKSKALFTQVTKDIRRILCQIRELFIEVARDPSKQQDLSDISPIREQVNMDATVKLNHWLIYREYHNLMDYSQELLDLIIKKYQN
ncbi:hypothetical protein PVAND_013130 [Polypedilum vanderplanki]|uniref:Uncharacterized protein n=1 Tax=Polypedilum vanderplanki TaxID=319348 RepID=A0A9J6CPF6_POLVA|nr:hypothetical protein PVAND_013130 [Polypedilum vanderplanki]